MKYYDTILTVSEGVFYEQAYCALTKMSPKEIYIKNRNKKGTLCSKSPPFYGGGRGKIC